MSILGSKQFYGSCIAFLSLAFAGLAACTANHSAEKIEIVIDSTKYKNPVFEPILADPTVVKSTDGWFYAYGTMDNWGDGNGIHKVPIIRSKNLVDWTFVNDAFLEKPNWKADGGIWAPDVVMVNDKYYLYYAFSTWGDPNPGIGLAIADSPKGPFTDHGKLFLSKEVDVPNSIDPFYFEENHRKYMFWGSYSNEPTQGTYAIKLTGDGTQVLAINGKIKIAAGDFEAVMIHERDGYYYFFGSKGSCCEGENSSYQVRVGRSKSLLGPYLDKDGRPLIERGNGTMLLQRTGAYAGPGHNSRIITDHSGNDWMLYHAIEVKQPRVSTGANRRVLMLDQILWNNNWPEINRSPSNSDIARPDFN